MVGECDAGRAEGHAGGEYGRVPGVGADWSAASLDIVGGQVQQASTIGVQDDVTCPGGAVSAGVAHELDILGLIELAADGYAYRAEYLLADLVDVRTAGRVADVQIPSETGEAVIGESAWAGNLDLLACSRGADTGCAQVNLRRCQNIWACRSNVCGGDTAGSIHRDIVNQVVPADAIVVVGLRITGTVAGLQAIGIEHDIAVYLDVQVARAHVDEAAKRHGQVLALWHHGVVRGDACNPRSEVSVFGGDAA